jgi:hypothetical protein
LILHGAGSAVHRMSVHGCGQHSYPVPLHSSGCVHHCNLGNFVANVSGWQIQCGKCSECEDSPGLKPACLRPQIEWVRSNLADSILLIRNLCTCSCVLGGAGTFYIRVMRHKGVVFIADYFIILYIVILLCSHVLGEDRPQTSYTRVMGHMDVVSIISDYFNILYILI